MVMGLRWSVRSHSGAGRQQTALAISPTFQQIMNTINCNCKRERKICMKL